MDNSIIDSTKHSDRLKHDWQKIYKKYFGKILDFSDLDIPASFSSRKHFGIIVAQGITISETIEAFRKKIDVSLDKDDVNNFNEDNIDSAINNISSITNKDKDYVIFFEKISQKKSSQLSFIRGNCDATLLEHLLLELFNFIKRKKALNVDWKYCFQSFCSTKVITVSWKSYLYRIGWAYSVKKYLSISSEYL